MKRRSRTEHDWMYKSGFPAPAIRSRSFGFMSALAWRGLTRLLPGEMVTLIRGSPNGGLPLAIGLNAACATHERRRSFTICHYSSQLLMGLLQRDGFGGFEIRRIEIHAHFLGVFEGLIPGLGGVEAAAPSILLLSSAMERSRRSC